MFSYNANKRIEVVTYFEAVLVLLVFSFVLYLLYPKDMLEKQVLSENSNYDLTAVYLENMLRLEPQNRDLMKALLEASIHSGQYDLAMKMIAILEKDASVPLLDELMKDRFEALKMKYFSTNEQKFHTKIRAEIARLLQRLIEDKHYSSEDLEYWYKGAREFSLNESALYFLYQLLEKEEKSLWLEECFYLSADIKDEPMQSECLSRLRAIDTAHYDKWTQEAYYLALEEKKTERALSLLKDMASRSLKWRIELAKFYVEMKRYKEGAKEYMILHDRTKAKADKKFYLIKALQALQYGSLLEDATVLARQYEADYYKDEAMSRLFIKLYLSAEKLEDAKRVSIKRLRLME